MRLIFLVFRFFYFLCKFIIIGEGGSTQINDLGAADARIKLYYVLKLFRSPPEDDFDQTESGSDKR